MTAEAELIEIERMLSSTTLDEVDKALAEMSLYEFLKQAWPVIEPGTPFVDSWAIQAMCEHYEAVTNGQIRNLLVNIPPRSCKSSATSVAWPVWSWIHRPESRWMFASYAANLARRDSQRCRRVIESPWFRRNWGDLFHLSSDQNTKDKFENNKTGFRMATSIGGAATGEGGDYLVADDPHNVMDAFSDAALTTTVNWFNEVWCTRLNDPKTGRMVVIMQRVHEKDVSGHILAQGGWEHLILPAEFESNRRCTTSIGWEDPRKIDGELLWPERVGPEEIVVAQRKLGSYAYAGQYQQTPAPRGGGMFKREWFKRVKVAPTEGRTVRYWDRSFTDGDGDHTAGPKVRKTPSGQFYILDVARFQTSAFGTEQRIKNTGEADGLETCQVLEEDPAAGKSEAAYLIRALAGLNVRKVKKRTSKEMCAYPAAAQAEAGNVFIVEGTGGEPAAWIEPFLNELASFPKGRNDDQVDGFSGAVNQLNEARPIMFAIS